MADYLLKGAKMLDKACPECGSPLFTVKGDTFCVVCRESKGKIVSAPEEKPGSVAENKSSADRGDANRQIRSVSVLNEQLYNEIANAVSSLCRRIDSESRPKDCLIIMESVNAGIDALRKLEESC